MRICSYKVWTLFSSFFIGIYLIFLLIYYGMKNSDDNSNQFHSIISDHFHDILNNNFGSQINYKKPENWNTTNLANIAYFLMISEGEEQRGFKLLQKILVKQNIYLIHLDKKMPQQNTDEIISGISNLNNSYSNIHALQSYIVSYRGITMVDIELTAMAYALQISKNWTHYINLSPTHYPLMTQFQIAKLLGELPKKFSFAEARVADCGYVYERMHPIFYDVALGWQTKNQIINTNQRGDMIPLKIFKASQWKLFSRNMVEYMVFSEDGLARRLLMFFANTLIPDEHFFPTVICNSKQVNESLRVVPVTYKNWDDINWKQRAQKDSWGPNTMSLKTLRNAIKEGGLFARKFGEDIHSRIAARAIDKLLQGASIRIGTEHFTMENVFNNTKKSLFDAIQGETCQQMYDADKKQPCKSKKQ